MKMKSLRPQLPQLTHIFIYQYTIPVCLFYVPVIQTTKQKTLLTYHWVSDITIFLFLLLHLIPLRKRIIPITVLVAYLSVFVVNYNYRSLTQIKCNHEDQLSMIIINDQLIQIDLKITSRGVNPIINYQLSMFNYQ